MHTTFFCRMLFVSGPAFLFTLSLACAEGLVAYAYFTTQGCDPIASGDIKKADQVNRFYFLLCLLEFCVAPCLDIYWNEIKITTRSRKVLLQKPNLN